MKRSRRENPAAPPPTPPGGRQGQVQGQSHAAGGAGGGFQVPIDFMGLYWPEVRRAEVFEQAHGPADLREMVSTFVHESSHARSHYFRRDMTDVGKEEYMAVRREFMFKEGRRPTLDERKQIRLEVDLKLKGPKGNGP